MTKKGRRKKGERIPWDEMERLYVEGTDDVTHAWIAERYNLKAMQVGFHASENHWTVKRLAHRSRLNRAISEKVFQEKVSLGVEVRLRGIKDRLDHMERLSKLRQAETSIKLMKLKQGDEDEVYEYEIPWSLSDHTNHRKAFDEAEAGILRSLGVENLDLGGEVRVPRYIPTSFLRMMLAQREAEEEKAEGAGGDREDDT